MKLNKLFNMDNIEVDVKYQKGDIIVWNGYRRGIFRIKHEIDSHYCTETKTHTHLHEKYMRHATDDEIRLLGDKNHILFAERDYNKNRLRYYIKKLKILIHNKTS